MPSVSSTGPICGSSVWFMARRRALFRQFRLYRRHQAGIVGRGRGCKAGGDAAVLRDQELFEIPEHFGLRIGRDAIADQLFAELGALPPRIWLRADKPGVERMLFSPGNHDLPEHREVSSEDSSVGKERV